MYQILSDRINELAKAVRNNSDDEMKKLFRKAKFELERMESREEERQFAYEIYSRKFRTQILSQ